MKALLCTQQSGQEIWINPTRVLFWTAYGSGTYITLFSGISIFVKESAEQIDAAWHDALTY